MFIWGNIDLDYNSNIKYLRSTFGTAFMVFGVGVVGLVFDRLSKVNDYELICQDTFKVSSWNLILSIHLFIHDFV